VVRAPRIKKEVVETRVRTEEARRVPGTQGDTLKVVQNLPGVARSAFGSGALIVWGSAPQETRVNVEGMEVPALYHVGGMRSTVNSDMVKSINSVSRLLWCGIWPWLGRSGPRGARPNLPREGVHGYVAADVQWMPLAWCRRRSRHAFALAVAGRQGYLDHTLKAVVSRDVGRLFPNSALRRLSGRGRRSILAKDEDLSATVLRLGRLFAPHDSVI
jgi:hypothetical protein